MMDRLRILLRRIGPGLQHLENKEIVFFDATRVDYLAGPLPRYRDFYLLSNVIHDWDDARATTILRNCRKAMTADARLLVIEEIMPSRVTDSPDTVANDFAMLLLTGGKERTAQEYRGLFDIAGLRIATQISLKPSASEAEAGRCWRPSVQLK